MLRESEAILRKMQSTSISIRYRKAIGPYNAYLIHAEISRRVRLQYEFLYWSTYNHDNHSLKFLLTRYRQVHSRLSLKS
jgi:hypothetical protein